VLGFEGTETPGNRVLNFPRPFSYDLFLISVSTVKTLSIKLYCMLMNEINCYLLFRTSVTQPIKQHRLTKVMYRSVIVRETIVLLVYGSCSGRFIGRAVSEVSRQ